MPFLTPEELQSVGLKHSGRNVLIDGSALLFGAGQIELGDNVRIDAFCILSAGQGFGIRIAGHAHISAGAYLYANGGDIALDLLATISPGCRLFTLSDDFSEGMLRGPLVPEEFRKTKAGHIRLGENAGIAANVVVLPGVDLGVNATVAANVVVRRSVPAHSLLMADGHLRPKDAAAYEALAQRAKAALRAQGFCA